PVVTAVGGAEQALVGEVQRLGAAFGEGQRQRPCATIVRGRVGQGGVDAAGLVGVHVELVDLVAVDDVVVVRIGRDHPALAAGGDLVELLHGDAVATVATAGQRHRTGILLCAVDPVRKLVVGADVIDLRGRLVQPAGPGLAAVQGDQGPLVDNEDLPVRVGRVDPHLVEIVA